MTWQDNPLLDDLLAAERIGLVTDFDGTLSPVVPHANDAAITPRNKELLTALNDQLPLVAIMTGRGAEDAYNRAGIEGLVVVGNHGFEEWRDGELHVTPEVEPYMPNMRAVVRHINKTMVQQVHGMWVEDKGATISVHYRETADPDLVEEQYTPMMESVAEQYDLAMFPGRRIFEIRPPLDVDKGEGYRRLVDEYELGAALYVGDDVTDVHAFKAAHDLREAGACVGVAVGVEADETPDPVREKSDFTVEGVEGVEAFYAWLLERVS
jgi:trehalose 6-phosphate phosphatase